MPYALTFILNLAGLYLYIRIAEQYRVLDMPNPRSSHREPTVRGGGLLLAPTFIGGLLWQYPGYGWSALAIGLAAAVSLIDDLSSLSVRMRLSAYFVAVGMCIVDVQPGWHFGYGLAALILITTWLNIFNFMDGINGMTVAYSLVLILSLVGTTIYFEDRFSTGDEVMTLGLQLLPAILAFALFNFRKKARCFAGDVGSVSLAIIIAWLWLQVWSGPSSFYLLAFPALYVTDSLVTLFRRLARGENILEPHRRHLYQLLANEMGWDQRLVSLLYGLIQALLNLLVIYILAARTALVQLAVVLLLYATLFLACFWLQKRIKGPRSIPV